MKKSKCNLGIYNKKLEEFKMTKQSLSKKTMFNYALLGLVSSAVLFPEIASAAAGAALPWEGPL
jgi:hypothetical protein